MEITTRYTRIGNGVHYLKVDRGELRAMKFAYEFYLYHVNCAKLKVTEDVLKMQKALKEIREALE